MKKTLVKCKIVHQKTKHEATISIMLWKRVFLCFGYWYPFGVKTYYHNRHEQELKDINDDMVSKILHTTLL